MFGGNRRRLSLRQRLWLVWSALARFGVALVSGSRAVWRPVLAVAIVAGAVVGGFQGYDALRESPHFLLAGVDVTGNQTVGDQELIDVCGLALHEMNLLFSSSTSIMAACESDPRIRRAEVRVELPDRVAVNVEEQWPVMYAAMEEGLWSVNQYGEPYAPAVMTDLRALPLLVSSGRSESQVRDSTVIRDALALVRVVGAMESPWRGKSLVIEHDHRLGFTVSASEGGLKARFGQPPFAKKFERLNSALKVAGQNQLGVEEALLDNSARPNAVTLRVRLSGPLASADRAGRAGTKEKAR